MRDGTPCVLHFWYFWDAIGAVDLAWIHPCSPCPPFRRSDISGNSSRSLTIVACLAAVPSCKKISVPQFRPSFYSGRRCRPRALTIYGCREEASDKSVAGRPELMDRQFVTSRPAAHMRASASAIASIAFMRRSVLFFLSRCLSAASLFTPSGCL